MNKCEKKIAQARVAMMLDNPFFGYLSITLDAIEAPTVTQTMGTDGLRLYYNPAFIEELSQEEMKGVLAHEIAHIILWHPKREAGRDHEKWNDACDYAVNALIFQERDPRTGAQAFSLPFGVLYSSEYEGKSAEWIYEKLPDKPSGGRGQMGCEGGFDSHELWKNWGKGDGEEDETKNGHIPSQEAIEQIWRERIAQAASQARSRGNFPGHLKDLVEDVLEPKLDWRTMLRDVITSAVKSDYRLIPPSKKHLHRNMYLPSMYGEEITVAYVIDGSGSISDQEAQEGLAELKGICDAYENYTIYIMCCDTEIYEKYEIHNFDPLPEIHVRHGGTSFKEPFEEAYSLPISCLIYATDLYGDFPEVEPPFPVLWLAYTDAEAPWGTIIRIPRERREGK